MRWVIRGLVALVILALLAGTVLFMVPSDRIAALLARQVKAATGAELAVAGAVRPTLWPEPGITLNGVSLAAAGQDPVLSADSISVGVSRDALWGGEVKVRSVVFESPVIRLLRAKDGTVNWDFATAPAPKGKPATETASQGDTTQKATPQTGVTADLTLDEGVIRNGTVEFTDAATGQSWSARNLDLTLRLPSGGQGEVMAAFTTGDLPVSVAMQIDDLARALGGAVVAVGLEATAGASKAAFKGRAGFAPAAAEGDISADLSAPQDLARAFGVAMTALPKGFGRDAISLTGKVTWTADRSLHLRDGRLTADGNALSGAFDLTTKGERPMLSARLSAGRLSLPGGEARASSGTGGKGTASSGTTAKAPRKAKGWPKDRIDASALSLLDTKVRLTAEAVEAGGQTLSPFDATLSIERARAVLDIARIGIAGGTVTGQAIANNRSGLSVAGDLRATDADIGALARMAGYDRLSGRGSAAVKFLGAGESVAQIMSGIDGNGDLTLDQAQFRGIDLARALTDLDPAAISEDAVTPIERLTASYTVSGGVLTNEDLAMTSPAVTVRGRGIVDLGKRTLDYQIVPRAMAAGRDLRVPLLVTGPWENPSLRLDLESVAEEKLQEQGQNLRDKAAREAAKKLGVKRKKGETVEDAVRRKLEEDALKGLGGLLGGE